MKRTRLVWIALWACLGGSRSAPAEEPSKPACGIFGDVTFDGRPVAASVEVRLRIENPRFPHGFHWTASAVERELLPPPLGAAPVATVHSGADGRFEVGGIAPARYWVVARNEAGAWTGVHVPLHAAGQRARVTLDLLPATERLQGRLAHRDGTPFHGFVAASRTRLLGPDRDDVEPASVRWVETDAEGRFSFEGLSKGQAWLSALWPGRLLQPLGTLDLPHEAAYVATVDAVERPVEGRVLDIETDEPVPGASVVWSAYSTAGASYGVETTAKDGAYALPSPVEVYSVHVVKTGYAERYLQDLGGVGRGTVRIRRGVRITGRVLTAAGGSPGAGLGVERRGPGSYWYQWTHAVTDAEGRFSLEDQAPGEGRVYARGLGWVPQGLEAREPFAAREELPRADPFVWTVEPKRSLDVSLTVERGAAIVGRVLDADDHPVAGVPAIVKDAEDPEYSWEGHGVPPVAASLSDGTFRIDGLLAGAKYKLSLRPAGAAPIETEATARGAAQTPEPLEVHLPAPHWILVRVVDAKTRQPVPGARVELMLGRRDDRVWRTDEKGVARVGPLGPVGGDVDVRAPGYIDANQRSVPQATREGAEVTIPLDPALSIEGRVVGADGKPAPEAIVYVAEMSEDVWKTYRGKEACDAEGRFVAERVHDIDYRLAAVLWKGKERFEATAIAHGGARDVVLTLAPAPKSVPDPAPSIGPTEERPPAARLRVVDPEGRPVARAEVSGIDAPKGVVDGEVLVDRAPAPDATIVITHAAAEDGIPLPLGPLRLSGWPKGPGDVPVVTMPPERAIEGRVVDPEGAPVPRAVVRAVLEDGGNLEEFGPSGSGHGVAAGRAVSRSDGTFRVGGLERRAYALDLVLPLGFLAPLEGLRAEPGVAVEIRLRHAVAATIVVTAPGGGPAPAVEVVATRGAWSYFWRDGWTREDLTAASAVTDDQGRAVLRGLDPGLAHGLRLTPPKERLDWFPHAQKDWRPTDLAVALEPRGVIRGRIDFGKGDPKGWTYVHWRQSGAWQAKSVQGGPFHFDVPVAGEVELFAAPKGLRKPLPTTRVAKARTGDEGVTLDYEPGASLRVRAQGIPADAAGTITWALVEEGTRAGEAWAIAPEHVPDASGGDVVFEGLEPAARYTVLAVGAKGGVCGRLAGVAAAADAVLVALAPGATIEGRLLATGRMGVAGLVARPVGGGPELRTEPGESGAFRFEGLTPGRWRLRAYAVVGTLDCRAEAEVDAGGRVDLRLLPR